MKKVNFYAGKKVVEPYTTVRANLIPTSTWDHLYLVTLLQAIFQAVEEDKEYEKAQKFREAIVRALDVTPGIGFGVGVVDNSTIFYPKGAYLLDEEIINKDLSWLSAYPKVAATFENNLKTYMEGDKNKYRDVVDGVRQTIELLLKEILDNSKSLETKQLCTESA